MSNALDKFVDAFIEHAMKATGMTREELLKGWSVASDKPVIEVGDVVRFNLKCSTGECKVIKIHGDYAALLNISHNDRACACSEGLLNLRLIHKGPKVHRVTEPLINREHFVSVPKLISCDMPYGDYHITLTLTKEAVK